MKKFAPYITLLFPLFFIAYGLPYPEAEFRHSFILNFSNIHSLVLSSLYGAMIAFHPTFIPFRNNLCFASFRMSPGDAYIIELLKFIRHPITVTFQLLTCIAVIVLFRSTMDMVNALLYAILLMLKSIYYLGVILTLKYLVGKHRFNQSFGGALQVLVLYHMIVSSFVSEAFAPVLYYSPIDMFFLLPFKSYPNINPLWLAVPLIVSMTAYIMVLKRNRVWL